MSVSIRWLPGRPRRAVRGRLRTVGRRVLAASIVLAGGCFSYAPARPGEIMPGQDVRVTVEQSLALRYAEALGSTDRTWEGRVEASDGGSLLIAVPTSMYERRGSSQVLSQRIRVSAAEMLAVEVRTFDWSRTGVVIGLGSIAVAVAIVRGWAGLGGGGDGPGGPDRDQLWRGK